MDPNYNLIESLRVIIKWRKPIIAFVLLASIGGIIVSMILPNYYESSSMFYPTNPTITDRQNLFSKESQLGALDYFGTKDDVSRLLSIANSAAVVDYIMNKHDFQKIYDIDTTKNDWRYWLKKEFTDNLKVLKTEHGAVMVSFMDIDPKRAAQVTNEMVAKIDEHNNWVIISNKQKILKIFEEQVTDKRAEVKSLTDSLTMLMDKYDIKIINQGEGRPDVIKGSDQGQVENFRVLRSRQQSLLQDLNFNKTLLDQYDASAKQNVSSIYVIEQAYPADRKVKPIRWLICASTSFLATFLSIMGALLFEKAKKIKEAL